VRFHICKALTGEASILEYEVRPPSSSPRVQSCPYRWAWQKVNPRLFAEKGLFYVNFIAYKNGLPESIFSASDPICLKPQYNLHSTINRAVHATICRCARFLQMDCTDYLSRVNSIQVCQPGRQRAEVVRTTQAGEHPHSGFLVWSVV
jgi:hypothetical protein